MVTELITILKRYSDSKSGRWWKALLKNMVTRWEEACRESFKKLPKPPELISASEFGRRIGVSHVTAKIRLEEQGYVNFARGLFCEPNNPYLPFLMKTKLPIRFVKTIEKLRELPDDFVPTVRNIKKYVGTRGYWSISPTCLLGKIRSPIGRHTVLVFVPRFISTEMEEEEKNVS